MPEMPRRFAAPPLRRTAVLPLRRPAAPPLRRTAAPPSHRPPPYDLPSAIRCVTVLPICAVFFYGECFAGRILCAVTFMNV